MAKKHKTPPSPCIDVCKHDRQGNCVGCSMSKAQKSSFKALNGRREKEVFLHMILLQLRSQGGYDAWAKAYRKKCRKKGAPCPLDAIEALAA